MKAVQLSAVYGTRFYDAQAAGSYASAQVILPIVFKLYKPRSIVDFGAGVGTFLRAAEELGVQTVLGIEGPWVKGKHPESIEYIYANLEERVFLPRRFDLAISLEVAEHLIPTRAESFVEDICRASDVILFSAALKGQGGTNHIHENTASFWREQFNKQSYEMFDCLRAKIWDNQHVMAWYRQNTYLYVNSKVDLASKLKHDPLLNIVHPHYYKNSVAFYPTSILLKALLKKARRRLKIRLRRHS
jgi:SAM-dependent methyltransferase